MSRLEKKCLMISAGIHLLLVAVLVIGPAFMPRGRKALSFPIIDFVAIKTTDANMSGGGTPNVRPPPAAPAPKPQPVAALPPPPAPAQPQPEPERAPKPELTRAERTETLRPSPDSLEPSRDHKQHKVEVSKKLVSRRSSTRDEAKQAAEEAARADARAQAMRRQRLAREFGQAAQALAGEESSSTKVELPGPGGGGVPYANFLQAIQSIYQREWLRTAAETLSDRPAVATASVTIGRDGTVLSSQITESSGNRQVDRAVRLTLERVDHVSPLPDGAAEDKRTVTIEFEAKPKLGTG